MIEMQRSLFKRNKSYELFNNDDIKCEETNEQLENLKYMINA